MLRTSIIKLLYRTDSEGLYTENSTGGYVESDSEMQQLFTPFRGYCARKGVNESLQ